MGGKANSNAAQTPHYTQIQLQTSAEGLCIPICWGRNRVSPNLIWTGNFETHKPQGGGGKGGKGGGKGGGCFAANTLVSIPGGTKRISEIKIGDEVTSYDPVSDSLCAGTVTEVHKHPVKQTRDRFLMVTLQNGTVLKPTSNHYFWRRDGERIEIKDYLPGFDTLIDQDGNDIEIASIGPATRERFSYNLTVTPHHNFYVHQILAHNGGKGGGGKNTATTYSAGVTLAICEGTIQSVGTVFKDNTTTTLAALGFTLFLGDQAQEAQGGSATKDPNSSNESGASVASSGTDMSYRLTAYVHADKYDLGAAPTLPQHSFEVNGFFQGEIGGIPDVDPADIIFDLCTNPQYGIGMPVEAIGDRTQYSSYCRAMKILMSPVLSSQEQAISVLQRWAQITNTWIFWSENRLKFVPLGDTSVITTGGGPIAGSEIHSVGSGYAASDTGTVSTGTGDATWRIVRVSEDTSTAPGTPPLGSVIEYTIDYFGTNYGASTDAEMDGGSGTGFTIDIFQAAAASYIPDNSPIYDLTWEDFERSGNEAPVTVTRGDPADASNWIKLDIADRGKEYNSGTVEFKDQNSIELYGLMQAQSVQAREICERSIGATVAAILGKRSVYIRNTYTFKLGYNFLLLEPGDLVTLTDPAIGLDRFPVRIRTIDEDSSGVLSFEAEEAPAGIGTPALFDTQGWIGFTPPPVDVEPGSVNPPAIIEPPASVTLGAAEIWIGVSGYSVYWGGCEVFASLDDVTYIPIGTIVAGSPQGTLINPLPLHTDPDTVDVLSVDLDISHQLLTSAMTHADADAGRSMVLIDQELIGVGAAVPNPFNSYSYDLSYLRRGMFGTTRASHATSALVCALIPDRMLKASLPKAYVGQTIYLKFPSFNHYGGGGEDISVVTRYTYVPTGVVFTIAPPAGVTLTVATAPGSPSIAMRVVWIASTGPNLGWYEVEWSTDSGTTWTGPDVTVGANGTSHTLSPAVALTNYVARVRSLSGDGQAASGWVSSGAVNSGPAPSTYSLPLVNGDIPVGIMVDPDGAMVMVAQ
jgi:Putative phage tail protein/Pretoxin HINT domain